MHSKLSILRSQLQSLQAKRALVRIGSAACAILLLMLGLWAIAFVVDVSLRLSFGYRFLMLAGWIATAAWGFHQFAWPALIKQETVEDLALIVERKHQIDSDLIGALQFESPAAQNWGSPRLASAVIDYVAEFSPGLNVFEGFTYDPLPKRVAAVCVALLAFTLTSVMFPGHVSAFWSRFWLGSARYPSRTVISELMVNGHTVPAISPGKSSELRLPQGSALDIHVRCEGQVPGSASVRLQDRIDRAEVQFEMKSQDGDPRHFAAEHALPSSDVLLQVFAGDTWSDPLAIRVVPLPVVDVQWQVTQPAYAEAAAEKRPGATARYLSVLEGSKLQIAVRGTNKQLKQAELQLDDRVIPLVNSSDPAIWSLPAGTPLDSVRESGTYEIRAVDEDGLSLTPPIAGSIRLKADRAPRVASAVVTKLVIPTAKPRLAFGATDDYGLSQIRVQIEVVRSNGESDVHRKVLKQVSAETAIPAVIRDETRLDLSPYKLEKGDELRLTVEALDYRGGLEPHVGTGEPLLLKVTDRSGILSGLNESDQFTVKQLDTIILRELGIGGDPR